jgi:hypothetical protein
MRTPGLKAMFGIATCTLLACSTIVAAAPQDAAVAAAPAQQRANPFGTPALDTRSLAAKRGGTQVFNEMQLRGVVTDNQAVDVVTGNNQISHGAFSGASGLPMVIQNSGNNVLIQNATIVNVQLK